MKKKVLGVAIVAAIVLVSGWNVSQNKSEAILSDVTLANVEALAQTESGKSAYITYHFPCYGGYAGGQSGNHTATSVLSPTGVGGSYHSHSCSSCGNY
ncbi:hypothetical protein FACS1894199_06010 [Bacteroidia bacterium]|nr:hypothetical protein FACS1894199_06010 [Bacteroidia bacterium]